MAEDATTIPFCASASFARLKDSGIGAYKRKCLLARSLDRRYRIGPTYLGKVDTKCIHVHPIQETGKAFAETRQALVH